MYQTIQQFGVGAEHRADGTMVSVPALVEDDDRLRILLVGDIIPVEAWAAAHRAGAVGLMRLGTSGCSYVPADHFTDNRKNNLFSSAVYELEDRHWMSCEYGLGVYELGLQWAQRNKGDNPFTHLHTHSEFSAFDGYSTMAEIGEQVVADRQQAVAITDHGNCAGHPALQKMANELGIKPIFGIETYFVDDRFSRENKLDYRHLVLWAKDEEGLNNLWGLSTEAYRDGFYSYPRIDWDTLSRFRKGLILSTACLRGPLLEPFGRNAEQLAIQNLMRLGEIFGEDMYIELHTNHLPDQVTGNQWLIDVARKYNVPMIASVDAHYPCKDNALDHKVWMAMQTNKDVTDDTDLFGGDGDYYMMTAEEVRSALSYLPTDVVEEAIANTSKIAEGCSAEIIPKVVKPVYSRPTAEHPDPIRHDVERFVDMISDNWERRITAKVKDETAHFERGNYEFPMLIDKGYCGYYLICADFVQWAKDNGILVGPGRGSGAGSLAAYAMRITEIDPVTADLNVDRFMTPGRKSLPDFDIDFPSSQAEKIITYVQERWGSEHVARVGSHSRLKNKSAFKDTRGALASQLPPESFTWTENITKMISAAESTTAGLGLSWDELMDQIGELLDPYKEKMPQLFEYAEKFRSRFARFGKHAAGFIIDADNSLEGTLPLRRNAGENGPMVTQWDMEALEWIGKVKFDLLMIRNLDMIQSTIDAIDRETGTRINPYDWTDDAEYADPLVFEQLSEGWTLGVFQIETSLGTRTTKQLKPISRSQLADVITIGRPGPLRSGLDRVYMRRKNGEEEVSFPDERLTSVLAKTFGVMLYQEDIMAICTVLAGYDADEADHVRKILGKKKLDLVDAEGKRFIERAVANGTQLAVATGIWEQMKEFAKYSFNRAHAYSYATVANWEGWLKTHYPRQSLTNAMAHIEKDRIPQFVSEARRLGYQVLPPDINDSKDGFTAVGLVIRYGLQAIPGIGESVSGAIIPQQPFKGYDDFQERKEKACNLGHVKKLVAIGAFDSLHPNRRALESRVIDETTGVTEQCVNLHPERQLNNYGLPCTFDWDALPYELGRTGKVLKVQTKRQPPKLCTRGCKKYTAPPPTDYSHLPNYTDEEIRNREIAMLGVYLTSSPFDLVPEDVMNECRSADDLVVAENGTYPVVGIVTGSRSDRQGRDFGFATLMTPSGEMNVIIFSKLWMQIKDQLQRGTMAFVTVIKTGDDRYRLDTFITLNHLREALHAS